MSKNYDNWEKLVGAVLKREKLKQLALSHSVSCSDDDISSSDEGREIQPLSLYYDATNASIWRMFLLSQEYHPDKVSRSVSSLPDHLGILKKVVFLPVEAREFVIKTADSQVKGQPNYSMRHESFTDQRFDSLEVSSIYLPSGRFDSLEVSSINLPIDIRGKIKTRLLTSQTIYGVYLIYKKLGDKPSMKMNNTAEGREIACAKKRGEGWMEVEIGSFYVDGEGNDEVEAHVVETSRRWKGCLIIEGMEFRPLVSVKQL